jgi:predicted DNA binding CopG/RHH family protein
MPGYEVWVHHGEDPPPRIVSEFQSHEEGDYDRMEEMLDDVRHEILTVDSENPGQPTDYEDLATPEVQKSFALLKAAEEPLHEHTKVTVLVSVTRLMAIKSKFAFSNNCYKELLNLISDVLPENHKMPKDKYQSKKLLSRLGMDYEKIDVCDNNCMLF